MTEPARRMTAIEEILKRSVREWNESGELSRLRGQPLELSDESPEWFANRVLRKEGFSHPTIEAGRDVDDLADAAERTRERIRAHCREARQAARVPGRRDVQPKPTSGVNERRGTESAESRGEEFESRLDENPPRVLLQEPRHRVIAEYRERLMEYNRAALDFNLRAPPVMHKRRMNNERLVADLESETALRQRDA